MTSKQWFERIKMCNGIKQFIVIFVTLLCVCSLPLQAEEKQPDYLQQALKLASTANSSVLLSESAKEYVKRGDTDKALAVLGKIENTENRIRALRATANICFPTHPKFAESLLAQALSLTEEIKDNKKAAHYIWIGSTYSENNMPKEADQALNAAMQYSKTRDTEPSSQDRYNQLNRINHIAHIYAKAGRTNAFKKVQKQVLDSIDDVGGLHKPSLWSHISRNYATIGQYDRSMECLQQVKEKTQKTSALGQLALIMEEAGQTEKAMEIVHELSAYTNKFFSYSLKSIAVNRAKAGDWANAYIVAETIDKPMGRADSYIDLANELLDADKRKEALSLFQKTLALAEEHDPKEWGRIFVKLAEGLASAGQFFKAIEIADTLSDEPPHYGAILARQSARRYIAIAYIKQGKYNQGFKMLNSIYSEVDPTYSERIKVSALRNLANTEPTDLELLNGMLAMAKKQLDKTEDVEHRVGILLILDKINYNINNLKTTT